jgi:hypothetical protein
MGAPRKLDAPGRPEQSQFSTAAEFKVAYNRWYRKNYLNRDARKQYRKKEAERQKERRREIKAGVYHPMSERHWSGNDASAELSEGNKWYENRLAREAEIKERIEYIELPDDMSAEEYEKSIFL